VADFIGEANLIDCEILSIDGDSAEISVGKTRHRLPSRGLSKGKATLAIRPSRMRLSSSGEGLAAKVEKVTYVGARMEYTLSGDFGQVFAVSDEVDAPYAPGQSVVIALAASGPVLVPQA
jgi:iron(III) transport system ATP-binding protein